MKQQSIGIVLCAILFTTFGHEILNRHQIHQAARHGQIGHAQRSHYAARANTNSTAAPISCPAQCHPKGPTTPGANNLNITINSTTGIISVYNQTANLGLIIDTHNHLVGIFNGTSGDVIIINYLTQTGKVIHGVWYSSIATFYIFVRSITTLTVIWQRSGQTFNATNIPANVQLQIQAGLIAFGGAEWAIAVDVAFLTFIEIIADFAANYQVVGAVIASGEFVTYGSFNVWITRFRGFVSIIRRNVSYLITEKIRFDLDILNSGSTEILRYVFVIYRRVHLTLWTENNVFSFLSVVTELGGNITCPSTRTLSLLLQIQSVVSGQLTIESFIEFLIEYYMYSSATFEEFRSFIVELKQLLQSNDPVGQYKDITEQLTLIISEKYVVGGVNISILIRYSINYRSFPLQGIIAILYQLRSRYNFESSVGKLFENFLVRLTEVGGVRVVLIIIGSVEIDRKYLNDPRALWQYILHGFNLKDILHLDKLPVIGSIIKAFNRAFSNLRIRMSWIQILKGIVSFVAWLFSSIGNNTYWQQHGNSTHGGGGIIIGGNTNGTGSNNTGGGITGGGGTSSSNSSVSSWTERYTVTPSSGSNGSYSIISNTSWVSSWTETFSPVTYIYSQVYSSEIPGGSSISSRLHAKEKHNRHSRKLH